MTSDENWTGLLITRDPALIYLIDPASSPAPSTSSCYCLRLDFDTGAIWLSTLLLVVIGMGQRQQEPKAHEFHSRNIHLPAIDSILTCERALRAVRLDDGGTARTFPPPWNPSRLLTEPLQRAFGPQHRLCSFPPRPFPLDKSNCCVSMAPRSSGMLERLWPGFCGDHFYKFNCC